MNNIYESIRLSFAGERLKYARLRISAGILYPDWEKENPKISVPDGANIIPADEFWADFSFFIRARVVREHPAELTVIYIDHIDSFIHGRFMLPTGKFDSHVEVLNPDLILSWCIKENEKGEAKIERTGKEVASAVGMPTIDTTSIPAG